MLMELVKTKELQNSILDRVLEIEQSERNTDEVAEMEPRILTVLMLKRSSRK